MDFSRIQRPKWIHTVKLLIVLVVLLHAMRSVLYQSVHMDTRYCERIELVCDWIQHTQCILSLSASGSRSRYLSQYSHSCSCNGCRILIHAVGRACLFSKIACRLHVWTDDVLSVWMWRMSMSVSNTLSVRLAIDTMARTQRHTREFSFVQSRTN